MAVVKVDVVQMSKCSSMYKHYKIYTRWHAALQRIGCMDASVIEIYNGATSTDQQSLPISANSANNFIADRITYEEAYAWGQSYKRTMQHPVARHLFKQFMIDESNEENLNFWESVEAYRTLTSDDELKEFAAEIYKQYCSETSKNEINIDSTCRTNLKKSIQKPNRQTFDEAQLQIYKLVERDIYPRFVRSSSFQRYVADLIPLKIMQSWTSSYFTLMKYDEGRRLFREFLAQQHAQENLEFWEIVQTYRTMTYNDIRRKRMAAEIYNEFVSPDGEKEISVDSKFKETIKQKYVKGDSSIFDEAADQAYMILKRDYFALFVKSESLQKYLNEQIESWKNPRRHKIPLSVMKLWSSDFDALMEYDVGRQLFAEYLTMERADENIRFWEAVQIYKTVDDPIKRRQRGREIFAEFVSTDAETEINIDDKSRQAVKILHEKGDAEAFDAAEQHIYTLMKRDAFHNFVRSDYFKQFLQKQIDEQIFITPLHAMRSWSNDFDQLMKYDYGRHLMSEFLKNEHADENVRFMEHVQLYKTTIDDKNVQKRKQRAREIFNEFISTDAETEINIDGKTRQTIKESYDKGESTTFDAAVDHIYTLIKRDKYPKFVRSDFLKQFVDRIKEIKPNNVSSLVVQTWTTDFDSLMRHDCGILLFTDFLEAEHADETIRFWECVQSYKSFNAECDARKRKIKAKEIYNEFVAAEAPREIGLNGQTKEKIKQNLDAAHPNIFETAEREMYAVMKRDSYPRFVKSSIFKEFADANNVD